MPPSRQRWEVLDEHPHDGRRRRFFEQPVGLRYPARYELLYADLESSHSKKKGTPLVGMSLIPSFPPQDMRQRLVLMLVQEALNVACYLFRDPEVANSPSMRNAPHGGRGPVLSVEREETAPTGERL